MANAAQVVADPPDLAPDNDVPLTEKQAATDIESLLTDDLLGNDADPAPKEGDKTTKPREPDPLGEDEEDPGKDAGQDEDGSPETTGGKYVAANAKFKMADGKEITVGELARNNLFQSDYSRKTEELAREREVISKKDAAIAELLNTVEEERKFLRWHAEQNIPQRPAAPTNSPEQDPMAWLKYQAAMENYGKMVNAWQAFKNGEAQAAERKAGETQQQAMVRAQREVGALFEAIPILKDEKKATAFFDAIEKGAAEYYRFTQTEIAEALKQDHRYGLVLRDALAYRRAKTKAPEVQKELTRIPKLVRGSARQAEGQQVRNSIRKTTERLRDNPSLENGALAIEQLI